MIYSCHDISSYGLNFEKKPTTANKTKKYIYNRSMQKPVFKHLNYSNSSKTMALIKALEPLKF